MCTISIKIFFHQKKDYFIFLGKYVMTKDMVLIKKSFTLKFMSTSKSGIPV